MEGINTHKIQINTIVKRHSPAPYPYPILLSLAITSAENLTRKTVLSYVGPPGVTSFAVTVWAVTRAC